MPPTRRIPPSATTPLPSRSTRPSPSPADSPAADAPVAGAGAATTVSGDGFSNSGSGARNTFDPSPQGAAVPDATDAVPAPRVPGLARQGQTLSVDRALYDGIFQEAQNADWQGCGIEPLRYVEDRLDRKGVIEPLLQDDKCKIILHRRALSAGQAPGLDPQEAILVSGKGARDYPGRVYQNRENNTLHLVGIPGEDWFIQTLHMLATMGVAPEKIQVEGVPDVAALAARDLDATLNAHEFDSVVVGTLGALTQAVERSLRVQMQPAHEAKCLARMQAHLQDRAANARPDKRDRWAQRAQRLESLIAAHPDNDARLAAIAADPELKSSLAEHLRDVKDGAPVADLPMRTKNGKAKVFSHRIVETEGKKNLLLHIGGAHGDLAYAAMQRVLQKQNNLKTVAFYGTCGSFHGDRLGPDTFVKPTGQIHSTGSGREAVSLTNQADLPGALPVKHTNVSTLLEEHRAGLKKLKSMGETVDIEGYHVARAVSEFTETGRDLDFRMLLRVSDVANDDQLGAHRADRAGTSDYDGRRDTEEEIAFALGLLEKPKASSSLGVASVDGGSQV